MEELRLALKEGFRNFRRKRALSLAMTGCVAIAVFAIGTFAVLASNINWLLERWENRVELVAFLSRDLTQAGLQEVLIDIRSVDEVGEARLVDDEESLEELFSGVDESLDLGDVSLAEVLPPSVIVRLNDGKRNLENIREVASKIAATEGVDEVKFEDVLLERYLAFRHDIVTFTVGASAFWILVFGTITINVAGLSAAARRGEIRTLRMLGATKRLTRAILMIEGIAQGLVGSVVGIALVAVTMSLLSARMGGNIRIPVRLFVMAFAGGPLLALIASWISLRKVIAFVVVAALVGSTAAETVGAAALDDEVAQYQQELRRLTSDLEHARAAVVMIGEQERDAIDELEAIDKEIDELSRQMKQNDDRIAGNRAAFKRTREELAQYEQEYSLSRNELEHWLRMLCTVREPSVIEVILSDVPHSAMTLRREMVSLLAKKEAEALARVKSLREKLVNHEEALRKHIELDALYAEGARLQAEQLLERRKQRELLLAGIREKKTVYGAAIRDIELSAQRLQELIDAKHTAQPVAGSVPFREMKGLLPWPASGEVAVPFGRVKNPGSQTYTKHVGLDISAPAGSEIRAIHDGLVAYCDWFRGYGKLLILDHGGGYSSVYSHCSEIFVGTGDRVSAGQPIALVGETGSLKGPLLYFEIREDGQPVDPAEWLQRRNINETHPE